MAQFKDVFSTTWKVLLALVLISAIIGACTIALGGLGWMMGRSSSTPSAASIAVSADDQAADALRTTMPKSIWDRGMARAVRNHCFTEGMSKEEVIRAVGEPTERNDYNSEIGSIWVWQLPPGKCLKYDGDKCIEQVKNSQTIIFTAKGSVRGQSGCETLTGKYVYFSNSELFPPVPPVTNPAEERRAKDATIAQEIEEGAQAAQREAAKYAAEQKANEEEMSAPCPSGETRTPASYGSYCKPAVAPPPSGSAPPR
jgi:hypothetical protein